MKKALWLLYSSLLLTLTASIVGRPFLEVDALISNWRETAVEETPGDFAFSLEITPSVLLGQDEYFVSNAETDPYYPQAEEINRFELSTTFETTGLFIPNIGDPPERAPYMVLGFETDNFGFVNSYNNLGRITKIGFDIAEDQYLNPATELAGAIGLQLLEGKNTEYSDAENSGAGPTYIDNVEWIVEWDLSWRSSDEPVHPGFVPFFDDESRLDDISNFRLITLMEVCLEKIYVEGYHFFEAYNDTPYYYAMWEDYYVNENWGLSFNFDNRTDTDYEIDGSAALTPILDELEEYVTHYLPFSTTSEDGYVTLNLEVPIVVVASELPLMELNLTDPETTPNMPVCISGWTSALNGATYGNQPIDTNYLNSPQNVEIMNVFGLQTANINFFSASVQLDVYVTNQDTNITEPDPQPMGGNLVSMVTYSENIDTVDHYDGEDPSEYYTAYTFYDGGFLTLAPGYQSSGTKVQEMHFTIDILDALPYEGGGSSNGFRIWLVNMFDEQIVDTERYFELLNTDTTINIDYMNASAYGAVSFYLETAEIEDTIFTFKFSMVGLEYDQYYYSNEDQALFYARAFTSMTDYVWGDTENGICEGLTSEQWQDLADEYSYMSRTTQSLFVDNMSKMQSYDVTAMLERYAYLHNLDPITYFDFLNEEEPMERQPSLNQEVIGGALMILALLSLGAQTFYYVRKRTRLH